MTMTATLKSSLNRISGTSFSSSTEYTCSTNTSLVASIVTFVSFRIDAIKI